LGEFLIIDLMSIFVTDLFWFSLSSCLVLVDFLFLGYCQYHLGYPVSWHMTVHSTL
jgi:hypothetical protein